MARKKRETTSVSTLQSRVDLLKMIARAAGREDLLKQVNDIAERVAVLIEDYVKIRADLDPLYRVVVGKAEKVEK